MLVQALALVLLLLAQYAGASTECARVGSAALAARTALDARDAPLLLAVHANGVRLARAERDDDGSLRFVNVGLRAIRPRSLVCARGPLKRSAPPFVRLLSPARVAARRDFVVAARVGGDGRAARRQDSIALATLWLRCTAVHVASRCRRRAELHCGAGH